MVRTRYALQQTASALRPPLWGHIRTSETGAPVRRICSQGWWALELGVWGGFASKPGGGVWVAVRFTAQPY